MPRSRFVTALIVLMLAKSRKGFEAFEEEESGWKYLVERRVAVGLDVDVEQILLEPCHHAVNHLLCPKSLRHLLGQALHIRGGMASPISNRLPARKKSGEALPPAPTGQATGDPTTEWDKHPIRVPSC